MTFRLCGVPGNTCTAKSRRDEIRRSDCRIRLGGVGEGLGFCTGLGGGGGGGRFVLLRAHGRYALSKGRKYVSSNFF